MRRRCTWLAWLVGLFLLGAACSAGSDATPTVEANPPALPLDTYLPSPAQALTLAKARYVLAAHCMESYGITWPMPEPTAPDLLLTNDRWPLWLTEKDASVTGFDPPIEQSQAITVYQQADDVWRQSSPETRAVYIGWDTDVRRRIQHTDRELPIIRSYGGRDVPATGCLGTAQSALSGGGPSLSPPTEMAQTTTANDNILIAVVRVGALATEANQRSESDSRYLAMISRWRECMTNAGFGYSTPEAARSDQRWNGRSADAQEIATAEAYARCLKAVDYLPVATGVRVAAENTLVANHLSELSLIRQAVYASINAAKAIAP